MNILMQWAEKNDRPYKYISDKTGFNYQKLHRLKQLTDQELKETLTIAEIEQIQTLIPELGQTLVEL